MSSKIIPGYNRYTISNEGVVRNIYAKVTLKPMVDSSGYHKVNIYKWDKINDTKVRSTCYIHKLVAENFIPNPAKLKTIDHINRIRGDNRVANLRYLSNFDNQQNKSVSADKTYCGVHKIRNNVYMYRLTFNHKSYQKTGFSTEKAAYDARMTCYFRALFQAIVLKELVETLM